MKRKTLKLSLSILFIGILATASAVIILSNRLDGRFQIEGTPIVLSWVGASPNTATMYTGNQQWYNYVLRVENPTANILTGVHIELRLTLMPAQQWGTNPIHIEYLVGTEWRPLAATYNTEVPYAAVILFGTWPTPTDGYTFPAGTNEQISFRLSFEPNTPNVACDYEVWAYSD